MSSHRNVRSSTAIRDACHRPSWWAALTPFWPNLSLWSVNLVPKGPNRFAMAGEKFGCHGR
jgi:hypothetical protein